MQTNHPLPPVLVSQVPHAALLLAQAVARPVPYRRAGWRAALLDPWAVLHLGTRAACSAQARRTTVLNGEIALEKNVAELAKTNKRLIGVITELRKEAASLRIQHTGQSTVKNARATRTAPDVDGGAEGNASRVSLVSSSSSMPRRNVQTVAPRRNVPQSYTPKRRNSETWQPL